MVLLTSEILLQEVHAIGKGFGVTKYRLPGSPKHLTSQGKER